MKYHKCLSMHDYVRSLHLQPSSPPDGRNIWHGAASAATLATSSLINHTAKHDGRANVAGCALHQLHLQHTHTYICICVCARCTAVCQRDCNGTALTCRLSVSHPAEARLQYIQLMSRTFIHVCDVAHTLQQNKGCVLCPAEHGTDG